MEGAGERERESAKGKIMEEEREEKRGGRERGRGGRGR